MGTRLPDDASAQLVFDTVVAHLRKQGKQSASYNPKDNDVICKYRAGDGRECAVGCIIPDDRYDKRFEGTSITAAPTNSSLLNSCIRSVPYLQNNREMLGRLQRAHDRGPMAYIYDQSHETFLLKLCVIAKAFDLNDDVVQEWYRSFPTR